MQPVTVIQFPTAWLAHSYVGATASTFKRRGLLLSLIPTFKRAIMWDITTLHDMVAAG